jgi:hypothetical protein
MDLFSSQDVPFLQSTERLKCIASNKRYQRSAKGRHILDTTWYNKLACCELCSKAFFVIETSTCPCYAIIPTGVKRTKCTYTKSNSTNNNNNAQIHNYNHN